MHQHPQQGKHPIEEHAKEQAKQLVLEVKQCRAGEGRGQARLLLDLFRGQLAVKQCNAGEGRGKARLLLELFRGVECGYLRPVLVLMAFKADAGKAFPIQQDSNV